MKFSVAVCGYVCGTLIIRASHRTVLMVGLFAAMQKEGKILSRNFSFFAMKHADEELEMLLGEIPQVTDNSLRMEGLVAVGVSPVICSRRDECGESHRSPSSLVGTVHSIVKEDIPSKMPSNNINVEKSRRHSPSAAQEEGGPLASLGFTESHPHELPDESLITAFSNVKLDVSPKNSLHSPEESRNAKLESDRVATNGVIKASVGLYNQHGGMGSIPVNIDTGMKTTPLTICSNGLTIGKMYTDDAMMFAYADGLSAASTPSNTDNICNTSRNTSLYGGDNIEHCWVECLASNANSMRGNNNLRDIAMYSDYESFDHDISSRKHVHESQVPGRCQSSIYDTQFFPQQGRQSSSYVRSLPIGQPLHQDCSVPSFFHTQKPSKLPLTSQRKEEEWQRMQQILNCHSRTVGCLQQYQHPVHAHTFPVSSYETGQNQLYCSSQIMPTSNIDWRAQIYPRNPVKINHLHQSFTSQSENNCTFHSQGYCSKGEICPVIHSYPRGIPRTMDFKLSPSSQEKQLMAPVKILSRDQSKGSAMLSGFSTDGKKETFYVNGDPSRNVFQPSNLLSVKSDGQRFKESLVDPTGVDHCRSSEGSQSPQMKYCSLMEVEGHIYAVAKDQHGCRFLQRQFDEGGPEEIEKIFVEIIDHVLELMTDPFGNYLVQKLLDVCNEEQRSQILERTAKNGELINVSLNMHGTRAVQKLIETLTSSQQVSMAIASLRSGVVVLIKDLNGNHVIQRCLQHLSSEDSQFIFEAVTSHCVEIATHRHGCCVLQRCIDFSTGVPQRRLIAEIAANALLLSQDPFGNYVVQYVLDLGLSWATKMVVDQLTGNYAHLSMQKFSSNVVERCLKIADEDQRTCIIHELMEDSRLLELLQDPFANYVIQSALIVSKGSLHASLVEAICPHTPFLRSSPYGKRILSRRNMKRC